MLCQTVAEQPRRAAGNVRHFPFSGKVQVQNGSQEAVTMHVYIKSVVAGGRASFRGFMFAESVERDWFSYLDGYVCQPDVAHADWPGIFVRCPTPRVGCLTLYLQQLGPQTLWALHHVTPSLLVAQRWTRAAQPHAQCPHSLCQSRQQSALGATPVYTARRESVTASEPRAQDPTPLALRGREGDAIVEHPLRVHVELIYGHNVAEPARGTSNYMRKCMPYPFEGEIALQSPGAEFHIRLQGFRKVAAYSAGAAPLTCRGRPPARPDVWAELACSHHAGRRVLARPAICACEHACVAERNMLHALSHLYGPRPIDAMGKYKNRRTQVVAQHRRTDGW